MIKLKTKKIVLLPLSLSLTCSFIEAAFALTVYLSSSTASPTNQSSVLAFLISSFLLGTYSIIMIISEIVHGPAYFGIVFPIPYLFNLITGLLYIIQIIQLNVSRTQNLQYISITFGFFVLNQFLCGFYIAWYYSINMKCLNVNDHGYDINDVEILPDIQNHSISQNITPNFDLEKSSTETIVVNKKESQRTLIGSKKDFETMETKKIKHISEESENLFESSAIVNKSIANKHENFPEEYKQFIDTNWMDSGTCLSIVYPKQNTNERQALPSIKALNTSKSMPNFIKNSKNSCNKPGNIFIEIPTGSKRFTSNSSSSTYTPGPNTIKKAISMSTIGSKADNKQKFFDTEKNFLKKVNESLLPSVLKTGESPIMEIKRKQFEFCSMQSDGSKQNFVTDELMDMNMNSVFNSTLQDSVDLDLSEILEESVDQKQFHNFTQGTYTMENSTGEDNFDEEQEDDPMEGLERIPESSSTQILTNWKFGGLSYNNDGQKSYISLKTWKEDSEKWLQNKQRRGFSGSQVGIIGMLAPGENYGISKTAEEFKEKSDEHTDDSTKRAASVQKQEQVQMPPYLSMQSRSYSAPSLYTFRQASKSTNDDCESQSNASINMYFKTSGPDHVDTKSPMPMETPTTPLMSQKTFSSHQRQGSSSPIKKFFQESPKRIGSVFRKNSATVSRASVDLNTATNYDTIFTHKHNASLVSNTQSLFSNTSSRSGSPRKSLKSFLHKKQPSVQSVQLPPIIPVKNDISNSLKLYHDNKDMHKITKIPRGGDCWDLDTSNSSNKSRVSSVPSSVMGEYDREKWRTLKSLLEKENGIIRSNCGS